MLRYPMRVVAVRSSLRKEPRIEFAGTDDLRGRMGRSVYHENLSLQGGAAQSMQTVHTVLLSCRGGVAVDRRLTRFRPTSADTIW